MAPASSAWADTRTIPTVECSWERPCGVTTSASARTVPLVSDHISDAANDGFDSPDSGAHPSLYAPGDFRDGTGRDLALEQIHRMRDRRATDVLGRCILRIEAGREIETDSAEDVLDKGGAVEGFLAGERVAALAPFGMAQGDECADEFAQRVAGARGHEFQPLAQQGEGLCVGQPKVEHGERGIEILVEVFRDAILLDAETDVPAVNLQIGLDDPMVAVEALALKEEGVGPVPPTLLLI